jgi:hypothetical protein
MSDHPPDPKKPVSTPPRPAAREARERRLAQALRDNLRRRKHLKTQGNSTDDEV